MKRRSDPPGKTVSEGRLPVSMSRDVWIARNLCIFCRNPVFLRDGVGAFERMSALFHGARRR